jgi:hypothetical protein
MRPLLHRSLSVDKSCVAFGTGSAYDANILEANPTTNRYGEARGLVRFQAEIPQQLFDSRVPHWSLLGSCFMREGLMPAFDAGRMVCAADHAKVLAVLTGPTNLDAWMAGRRVAHWAHHLANLGRSWLSHLPTSVLFAVTAILLPKPIFHRPVIILV